MTVSFRITALLMPYVNGTCHIVFSSLNPGYKTSLNVITHMPKFSSKIINMKYVALIFSANFI
jgi:hypothetical protein